MIQNKGRFQKYHKISEETKRKISLAQKGKIISPETRIKMSLAKKGKPQNSPGNKGKKASLELRKKFSDMRKGDKHPKWKGGKFMRKGYIFIYKPNAPNAKRNFISEHRYIMQESLGRPLYSWEIVHHKNGIKTDNRLENLTIVSLNNHYGEINCPKCNYCFSIK